MAVAGESIHKSAPAARAVASVQNVPDVTTFFQNPDRHWIQVLLVTYGGGMAFSEGSDVAMTSGANAAAAPGNGYTYRPLGWIVGGLSAVLAVIAIKSVRGAIAAAEILLGRSGADVSRSAVNMLSVLSFVAILLFIPFVWRANHNARSFGAELKTSPTWAVVDFLVPFANLWLPYYSLKDIWQASVKPEDPRLRLKDQPVPWLLALWWWTGLLHFGGVGTLEAITRGGGGPEQTVRAAWRMLLVTPFSLAAIVLTMWLVTTLARAQAARRG